MPVVGDKKQASKCALHRVVMRAVEKIKQGKGLKGVLGWGWGYEGSSLIFEENYQCSGGPAVWIFGRRAFQAEGTASAVALRQECACTSDGEG